MLDKVIVLRKLFLKGFILSLVYYIAITIIYILAKDWFANILDTYYGINPHDGLIMCGYYLSLVEIITINLLLIPTLALHWLTYCLKKEQ